MRFTDPKLVLTYTEDNSVSTITDDHIVRDSIKMSIQWLKGLESSSNNVQLMLHRTCPDVMDILNAESDIKAVLKDGSSVIFTGYVSDGQSWGVTQSGEKALTITLEDVGTRLLPKAYKRSGGKEVLEGQADTIVRTIATAAGVELDANFPVINVNVLKVVDLGEKCQDLLKTLLKEVGYAYYFTNEGKMSARKIDCTSTSGVPVLNKDDLYVVNGNALTLSKKMRQYKSSKITYNTIGTRYETLIYKDISGQDSSHLDCNIELENGQTYPDPDGNVSYVEAEDLINGNEIIYIDNVVPEVSVSRGTVTSSISQYGADTLSVLLTCTSTSGYQTAIVSKLQAKADIVYVEAVNDVIAGVVSASSVGDNMVEEECEWIHTKTDADKLANLYVDYYKYCNRQFTFYSKTDIECGAIVRILDDVYSNLGVDVMVVGKSWTDRNDMISYSAVSVSAFDLTKPTTTTKVYAAPSSVSVISASTGVSSFFDINLSSGIYRRNSRKTTKQSILLSLTIRGYTETSAQVTLSNGSFSDVSEVTTATVTVGQNANIYIPYNNLYDTVVIRAVLNAQTEVRKTISAVNETGDWVYLGALTSLPSSDTYGYDTFSIGDHFLAADDFTSGGNSYTIGNCYFWTGAVWSLATTEAIGEDGSVLGVDFYSTAMSNCLNDAVDLNTPNQSQLGSWIKKLSAHDIISDTIMTKELIMTSTGSLRSSQYAEAGGFPTQGYKLTSNDGTLKAMNAMLRDVNIKCTDSQNQILLQTQRYQAGDSNISVRNNNLAARWCMDDASSFVGTQTMKACTYNGNSRKIYRPENVEYTYGYRQLIGSYSITSGGRTSQGTRYGEGLYTAPVAGYYYVLCRGDQQKAIMPGIMMENGAVYGRKNTGNFSMDLGYLAQGAQFLALTCTSFDVYLYDANRQYYICTESSDQMDYDGDWGVWDVSSTFEGNTYTTEVWVPDGAYMNLRLVISGTSSFDSNDYKNHYALSNTLANWSEGSYNTDGNGSSVTGGTQTLSVVNIGKATNSITFRDSSYNIITVSLPVDTNNVAVSGWYRNLNGTISLIAQQSGILTYNVLPSSNNSCSCGTTGQAWSEVVSYGFNSLSSRSEKKNIVDYEDNATDIINSTKVVSFNYKDDAHNEKKVGFIADDTNELMAGEKHNKFDLNNCVGLLLKAVQELSGRLDRLENK